MINDLVSDFEKLAKKNTFYAKNFTNVIYFLSDGADCGSDNRRKKSIESLF
jgi:hypothetical protein